MRHFLTFMAIISTATIAPAQSFPKSDAAKPTPKNAYQSPMRMRQAIAFDAYLKAASLHDHFTGTVLIMRDGKPIFEKAYGMASLELDVPNRLDTLYNLGSLTKQFTAMAIMQLQDAAKLKTGDSICTYLSDCPASWHPVTIRHLLLHQSGIPNYSSLPDWDERHGLIHYKKGELTRLFRNLPLDFEPGQSAKYSNSGYYLLSQIIEKASDQAYNSYLRANILDKLGMSRTSANEHRNLLQGRAVGYYSRGPHFINATFEDPSTSTGSGGLWSTTADMHRWVNAIDTGKLVSVAAYKEMFTPSLKAYAYGWQIQQRWAMTTTEHSGSQNGYSSYILRIPEQKVTIIILGNGDRMSAGRAATALAAIHFGQKYAMPKAVLRDTLWRKMESDGIAGALGMLEKMRAGRSDEAKEDDEMLVEFGYELLDAGKLTEAETVFRFNLLNRPGSAYSLDGLADIAIIREYKTEAISLFEQSLKIDPDNDYAKRGLKSLSGP